MSELRSDNPRLQARRQHFGEFYGLRPLPDSADAPFVVVHGNCQAGALRRLIESAGATAIRIPPVHEFTSEDVRLLKPLLQRADAFVTQPIVDGFRGLPVGSNELTARLRPSASVVRVPVLRFAGAFPFQVTVRPAFAPSLDPAVVPYHDLRTAIVAAEFPGIEGVTAAAEQRWHELTATVDEQAVERVIAASVESLRVREEHHDTVRVASLLARDARTMRTHHTLNHPTNAWFLRVIGPVLDALGGLAHLPEAPSFEMLGGIGAAIEPVVSRVLPLEPHPWRIGSELRSSLEIADAQLRWYRTQPRFVAATLERHRDTLALLGLPR